MNDNQSKRDEYLARASDAEEQANKSHDTDVRESWLRIAKSYRILAQHLDPA